MIFFYGVIIGLCITIGMVEYYNWKNNKNSQNK